MKLLQRIRSINIVLKEDVSKESNSSKALIDIYHKSYI